jgi:hypothetical protein
MNAAMLIKKRSGQIEEFNKQKLEYSLIHAGASKEQAKRISAKVYSCCTEGISTHKIFTQAFRLLKKESKVIAAQYSMPKAILELGPDGFNFEKFIAAMLKSQGFEVSLNNIMKGQCVKHEVDVIARKPGKAVYCECKFHNNPSTKNDLKTALYVHSRYLDLKNNPNNDVTEFWLVSNTKFSKDAIDYAKCVGLVLLGPNYPADNALADMARKTHIHPVTCLTSLKKTHARQLLKHGVVLTHEIQKNLDIFKNLGLNEEQQENVHLEVAALKRQK